MSGLAGEIGGLYHNVLRYRRLSLNCEFLKLLRVSGFKSMIGQNCQLVRNSFHRKQLHRCLPVKLRLNSENSA